MSSQFTHTFLLANDHSSTIWAHNLLEFCVLVILLSPHLKTKLLSYNSTFTVGRSHYKNKGDRVRVRVTLRLTVSQPVSLGVEPLLGLMTRFLVLYLDYCGLCSSWGALSDERVGLSFVISLCRLCRLRIFTLQYSICTICTRPLSVQAS
jgi:hypothetical protein